MNTATSLRSLGKAAAVYGLAGILTRVVSIFMLPIYTRYLSPAEYGLLALLDITVEVTTILFAAGMRAGMLRFYFRAGSEDERKTVVFTTFLLEMGLTVLGSLALLGASTLVWRHVLAGEGTIQMVQMMALNLTLSSLAYVPLTLMQSEGRAVVFSAAGMIRLAIQVACNVVFLVVYDYGVMAFLLSAAIAHGITGTALTIWLIRRTGVRVSRQVLGDLRRFGVPYQITTAGAFILAFGDRLFLQQFRGAAEVGLYGLAYQFGFILDQLTTTPFRRAWDPQRHQLASAEPAARNSANSRGFFLYNLLLLTIALGIAVYVRPALGMLTTAPFHSAADWVPLILAAYVVQGWGEAVKFGGDIAEQTHWYTYASWIAVVVVLVLYATLIPAFGGAGAAAATLGAFIVRFLLALYWSQRLWPVVYGWARVIPLTIVAAAAATVPIFVRFDSFVAQLVLATTIMAAYGAVVWFRLLQQDERNTVMKLVRERDPGALFRGT